MASQCMLTTFDNPYNPFTNFEEWNLFDLEQNYNTCSYLARIAALPEGLSDEEEKVATETAIDLILDNDFLNIYKKIYMDSEDSITNN